MAIVRGISQHALARVGISVSVAVGIALRMLVPTIWPLVGDEFHTLSASNFRLADLVSGKGFNTTNPPLFYMLARLSVVLFGQSDFALRFPAALASSVALIVFAFTTLRIMDRGKAMMATCLAAVNPCLLYFAGEARSFSLSALWLVLSMLILARTLSQSLSWRACAGLAMLSLFAVYTNYFSGLSLVVLSFSVVLLFSRRSLVRWVLSHCVAGIGFLPWLGEVLSQLGGSVQNFRAPESMMIELSKMPFFFSIHRTIVSYRSPRLLIATVGAVIILGWLLPLGAITVRWIRERRKEQGWLILWATCGIALSLALIPVIHLYDPKYVLGTCYGLIGAAVVGLSHLRGWFRLTTGACLVIPSLLASGLLLTGNGQTPNYSALARELSKSDWNECSTVVFSKRKYQKRIDWHFPDHQWKAVSLADGSLPSQVGSAVLVASDVSTDRGDLERFIQHLLRQGFIEQRRTLVSRFWLIELERGQSIETGHGS